MLKKILFILLLVVIGSATSNAQTRTFRGNTQFIDGYLYAQYLYINSTEGDSTVYIDGSTHITNGLQVDGYLNIGSSGIMMRDDGSRFLIQSGSRYTTIYWGSTNYIGITPMYGWNGFIFWHSSRPLYFSQNGAVGQIPTASRVNAGFESDGRFWVGGNISKNRFAVDGNFDMNKDSLFNSGLIRTPALCVDSTGINTIGDSIKWKYSGYEEPVTSMNSGYIFSGIQKTGLVTIDVWINFPSSSQKVVMIRSDSTNGVVLTSYIARIRSAYAYWNNDRSITCTRINYNSVNTTYWAGKMTTSNSREPLWDSTIPGSGGSHYSHRGIVYNTNGYIGEYLHITLAINYLMPADNTSNYYIEITSE